MLFAKSKDENECAQIAYQEAKRYLLSSDCGLAPDDQRGPGYWKLYAGGRNVGEVEIVL